jgi:recombination protein RecR
VSKVSPLVDSLIESIQCLPGVGPKSAQRMVLHLLEREREGGKLLSEALSLALELVGQCRQCRIFSEDELCSICKNEKRDKQVICVVESVSDVFAIEQSNQFRGKYFILHGHLSPIDDIGPEQLGLNQLFLMVRSEEISEMILATNSTLEGEATAHFIYDSLKDIESLSLTKLAQGVPLGGELEYVDRGTIMHAFSGRVNLKGTM